MQPTPAEAFDAWFRILGFRGRHALTGLQPMLRQQLQNLQKSFNEAFAAERQFPEHAPTLPMYLDYIDADDENAIATTDGQSYAFVGITLPLVFKISDVSVVLSKAPSITTALQLNVSAEPYNDLQGTLFYILVSFVVGHEWSHHKHGHLQQLSFPKAIFQEITNSGIAGSIETQLQEIGADGYSAFFLLSHILDHRDTFLPWLNLDPAAPPVFFDQVFLSLFVIAFASFLLLRPPELLGADTVYRFTHPPAAARMNFFLRETAGWCSFNRPPLEGWLVSNSLGLINLTADAILGAGGAQRWRQQIDFLKSDDGMKYTATLTTGLARYRKSWGRRDGDPANETAEIIEPPHELQLQLSSGPDDTEYPQALAAFARSLETANIPFANRGRAFDAAGAQGHSGLFAIAITLGPVAIIQLTKLIQSFLAHSDRKIKLTKGAVKLEGSVKDLQTLLTPEQIQQLIEAKPTKTPRTTKPATRSSH